MSSLSSHVLDTSNGMPASSIKIELITFDSKQTLAIATSDDDGRVSFDKTHLSNGDYTLRFYVKPYCLEHFGSAFFPLIEIHFCVDQKRHYHVPLLLSPFSFSSYRGS